MLHDVISGSGLAIFAEVALVLFLAVFLIAAVRAFSARPEHMQALARMPLHDDQER